MDGNLCGDRQGGARCCADQFQVNWVEVQYIVENSEAKALIVQHDLLGRVETIRAGRLIAEDKYIHFGGGTPRVPILL